MGAHLVEDLSNLGFQGGGAGSLDRSEFEAACDRLEGSGYRLASHDVAWPAFEAARATYSARLEAMAAYWAVPATQWLGDPVTLRQPLHARDDP